MHSIQPSISLLVVHTFPEDTERESSVPSCESFRVTGVSGEMGGEVGVSSRKAQKPGWEAWTLSQGNGETWKSMEKARDKHHL